MLVKELLQARGDVQTPHHGDMVEDIQIQPSVAKDPIGPGSIKPRKLPPQRGGRGHVTHYECCDEVKGLVVEHGGCVYPAQGHNQLGDVKCQGTSCGTD